MSAVMQQESTCCLLIFVYVVKLILNMLLNVHLSCRSGSFSGTSGINKSDGTSSPASSNARGIPKSEPEKVFLTRDFATGMNKERLVAKGNNKYVLFIFLF